MHSGAVIGGAYRLVRPVGKGGMGTVWSAVREADQQPVAIKLLTVGASEEMQKRLVREAEAAGRLRDPHVVDVLDVGTTDSGEPFLVMELLSGRTLRSVIKRERRLDPKLAATIIRDICLALRAAHAGNVVHRDLKPSNVVLHQTPDGLVLKVLDFGVSKVLAEEQQLLTSTGIAVGSPAYMSPEQARGARVDHRADLWSVGVLLFELVAGRRPFVAESPAAMLSMILFSEIPKVSQFCATLDPTLEAVITRCLQRKVSERYQSADEIIAALEPLCLPEIVIASPTPPRSRDPSEFTGSASTSLPTSDESTASASQASVPSTSSPSAHGGTTASTSHSTTHGVAMTPAGHFPLPAVRRPSTMQTRLQWVAATLAILLLGAVSALVLMRAMRDSAQDQIAAPSEEPPVPPVAQKPAAAPPSVVTPSSAAPVVVTAQPVVTAVPVSPPATGSADEPTDEPTDEPEPVPTPAAKPAPTSASKPAPGPAPARRPAPKAETKKPCASPIVDANGKVVGCL